MKVSSRERVAMKMHEGIVVLLPGLCCRPWWCWLPFFPAAVLHYYCLYGDVNGGAPLPATCCIVNGSGAPPFPLLPPTYIHAVCVIDWLSHILFLPFFLFFSVIISFVYGVFFYLVVGVDGDPLFRFNVIFCFVSISLRSHLNADGYSTFFP